MVVGSNPAGKMLLFLLLLLYYSVLVNVSNMVNGSSFINSTMQTLFIEPDVPGPGFGLK